MTRSEKGFFSPGPGLSLLPWEDFILKARRISPLVHLEAADKWTALLWLGFVPPPPQMSWAANERGEAGGIDLRHECFLLLPVPASPPRLLKVSLWFCSCGIQKGPDLSPFLPSLPPEGPCCGLTAGAPKSQLTLA